VSSSVHVVSQIFACCKSTILKGTIDNCALEHSQVAPIVLIEVALTIEKLVTILAGDHSNRGLIVILWIGRDKLKLI